MATKTPYMGREEIPGLEHITSGKVRDIYGLDGDRLLFVTSDRVSAFDVVFGEGIPEKGVLLTRIACHWFGLTGDIIPNHLISDRVEDVPGLDEAWRERLRGRVMIVQRCDPTSVEWVVRGYLAGSGWKEYQRTQSVCGVALPAGLDLCSKLPEAILTPTTKDDDHDRPLTPDEARERVGAELFAQAEHASLELFRRGSEVLAGIGVLLADTKFEFGLRNGELILIDEALTPDSSRFWPRDDYQPGRNQRSYDKQILRDWLETLDWNKEPPAPAIAPEIAERTAARYREIGEMLTARA